MSMNKRNQPRLGRRGFLGAGLIAAPTLWLPRRSKAETPVFGQVKHLIVIYTDGGMRSSCMFNSNVSEQWNPPSLSGVQAGADGTDWGVGGVFSPTAHDGGIVGNIPSLPMFSDEVCVLGTVDHTPGEDRGDGTHDTAKQRMATGFPDGGVGLLTRIYRDHPLYQGNGADQNLPPVVLGPAALFGVGTGEWGPHRPIIVNDWRTFRGKSDQESASTPDWALSFQQAVGEHHASRHSARHRGLIQGLLDSKRQAINFDPILTDPVLDIELQPGEGMHGLSNEQLEAAFGGSDFGRNVALALRFCGFGAPAVAVGDGGWDFHSNEASEFAWKAQDLDRVLSALRWALREMNHPDGGKYWDHTLVMVVSEFGRDNTELDGFNSGAGSDHHGTPPSRYQALPFMGGVVGRGGKFYGETKSATMEPKSGEPIFHSRSVLAMGLDVLGIDPTPHFPEAPLTEIF